MNATTLRPNRSSGASPQRRRGQALVELAVVLPLLILLVLGAVDVGRLFYFFQSVESAAAAGAQYGCESFLNAGNTAAIRTNALMQAADIAALSPSVTSSVSNNLVSVTVSATFNPVIHWPGLPSQVPLQRTVVMRILR